MMPAKLSNNEVYANVINYCNKENYTVQEINYNGSSSSINLKCNVDGYVWNASYKHIKRNTTHCKRCINREPLTEKMVIKRVMSKCEHTDVVIGEFNGSSTNLSLTCKIDGYQWESTYTKFFLCNNGCSMCANNLKLSNDFVLENTLKCIDNTITLISIDYNGHNSTIHLRCDCGNDWSTHYYNITGSGSGCPACVTLRQSKGISNIIKILSVYNIEFELEKKFEKCVDIRQLPFDIFLPHNNIIIEFDGIQHYHPVNFFGGEKHLQGVQRRDKIKEQYCRDNNIKLYRIRYDQDIPTEMEKILRTIK